MNIIPSSDEDKADEQKVRLYWNTIQSSSPKEQIDFILNKKNAMFEDVIDAIKHPNVSIYDAIIFLPEYDFKDFQKIFVGGTSNAVEKTHFNLTTELSKVNSRTVGKSYLDRIWKEKKEVLVQAAVFLYEQALNRQIETFSKQLRLWERHNGEIVQFLNQKVKANYDVNSAKKILNWFSIPFDEYQDSVLDIINDRFFSKIPSGLISFLKKEDITYYFPVFEVQYEWIGINCLKWVFTGMHAVAEIGVYEKKQECTLQIVDTERILKIERNLLGYYEEYVGPKDMNVKQSAIFTIPIGLLRELLERDTKPLDTQVIRNSSFETIYKVDGFPGEVVVSEAFLKYARALGEGKGLEGLLDKLKDNGILESRTYQIIKEQIKYQFKEPPR